MSEVKNEELKTMWKEQADTVRMIFPQGATYLVSKGENLAKLGEDFGIPWESIAEATMGTSKPSEINDWLKDNGGRKLPSGYWAFTPGQEVKIPPPSVSDDANA